MARDGCSTFRHGFPCTACDYGHPENCVRNKDEKHLWPKAKPGTICAECGKRYDEHHADKRLNKVLVCGDKVYNLAW